MGLQFIDYKTDELLEEITFKKKQKTKTNTECFRCNYKWFTTSKCFFICCPCCNAKVKLKEFPIEFPAGDSK